MTTPRLLLGATGRGRAAKAAAVASLAVLGAMLWAPTVLAVSGTAPVELRQENQAWYWSSNREVRQCIGTEADGLCQVSDLSGAAPTEPGHLAVGLQAGASDMRSYMLFDLNAVPFGGSVDSLTLRLNVSRADAADTEHTTHHTGPGAKTPATTNEARASITACAVTIPWGSVEGAPPYAMDSKDPTKTDPVEPFVKNGYDCNRFSVKGKAGNPWTFDLTKIAKEWVAGTLVNNGIVLLPDLTGGTDSWRMEFHAAPLEVQNDEARQIYVSPKEAGSATVTFTAPDEEPTPEPTPEPTGDGGGGFVPPAPTFEPAPGPVPTSSSDPQPAQPEQEPVAQPKTGSAWYAWLVLPLGAIAFSGLSRAVGKEAGTAGANRVADVLRRRRIQEASGD